MENPMHMQVDQRTTDWRLIIARILETIIGVILLLAGLLKAWAPMDFNQQISDYKIITHPALVTVIAWVMIVVECALGTALIVGYKRRIAVPAAIVLVLLFLAAVGWAWVTGATEDCGCFGSWVKRTPAEAFLEDAGMLIAIVGAWLLSRHQPLRFARWRLVAVMASILIGISVTALASNSARQSADPIVRLQAQSSGKRQFAGLAVSGLDFDLQRGKYLVMLMDTGCTHCQQSIPEVNRLVSLSSSGFRIVALCSNSDKEIDWFKGKFKAEFPIGRVSYDDFMRLFERGKTPRLMLIQDASVLKIWDGVVPAENEVRY